MIVLIINIPSSEGTKDVLSWRIEELGYVIGKAAYLYAENYVSLIKARYMRILLR